MKKLDLELPTLALLVMTRAFLGAGIALLASNKMSSQGRRTVGWTLAAIGALTTLPLALEVFGKDHKITGAGAASKSNDARAVGHFTDGDAA